MEDSVIVMCIFAFIAVAVLIISGIAAYFRRFNRMTRYLAAEMRQAEDYGEYRHWRRELRCHYLCLIPFVTERNVLRLYSVLFHRPRHGEKGKRSDGFLHILAPSAVGLCLCVACLCGMSWAWFTASTGTGMQTITTPRYTLEYSVEGATGSGGVYTLAVGSHTVTLTATGDTDATGYCKVTIGDMVYYTAPIVIQGTETKWTFTIAATGEVSVSFAPAWGSRVSHSEDEIIQNGGKVSVTGSTSVSSVAESAKTEETGENAKATVEEPDIRESTVPESGDVSDDTPVVSDAASPAAGTAVDSPAADGTETVSAPAETVDGSDTP